MKLTKVTLTGADDGTNPAALFEISEMYPFVEWGILLSRNSGGLPRYPSEDWLQNLCDVYGHQSSPMPSFSGHLCGSYVRDLLVGDFQFITNDLLEPFEFLFERVQINTNGQTHLFNEEAIYKLFHLYGTGQDGLSEEGIEFIFQSDHANNDLLSHAVRSSEANGADMSILFDTSHGKGIVPVHIRVPPAGQKCGYAGGLSADNILYELDEIGKVVGDAEIWIDMETSLRSDGNGTNFDLRKCRDILALVEPFIK